MTRPETATTDLAIQLRDARHGTAYFAHKLAELSDADFDGATLLPGWSRRHVVAHVAYNAQALSRLLHWAATGTETPMYASSEQHSQEINDGATRSPAELRNLFALNATGLDEKWQDLPASAWSTQVRTAQGATGAGLRDHLDAHPRSVDPRRRPKHRRPVQRLP